MSGLTAAYGGLAGNIFGALVDLPGPASSPGVVPMPQAAILLAAPRVISGDVYIVRAGVFGLRGGAGAGQFGRGVIEQGASVCAS